MKSLEKLSEVALFAVVSAYPVHNPHTAYTAVMSAALGTLEAFVREASCPVDPDANVVRESKSVCNKQPLLVAV